MCFDFAPLDFSRNFWHFGRAKMKKQKIWGAAQTVENAPKVEKFLRELLARSPELLPQNQKDLEKLKNAFAARENFETIQNRDLISVAKTAKISLPPELEKLLQKRAVRTISGVSPIGILTKNFGCPGQCTYCPTDVRMPKSYLPTQPAAARALRSKFHPFAQVDTRMRALAESAHPISKLEVIVMGGTWSALPARYQTWFVRQVFRAANEFGHAKIQIRKMQKKHWKSFIELEKNLLAQIGFADAPQINDWQTAQKKYEKFWVALAGGRVIGGGGFCAKNSKVAEIKRLRVHPDWQNQKVGQKILQKILREIDKRGFAKTVLDFSQKLSEKNIPFYQKFGFCETARSRDKWGIRLFFKRQKNKTPKISPRAENSLTNLQTTNETAENRIIGLTLETRPDWISEKEILKMRHFGCTRVEIGVQTLDDEVQKRTRRGHFRTDVVRAMSLLKNYGFKICFHLMPGLPGSSLQKDLKWMAEIFENPDFRPDFIKIYPCQVIPGTPLAADYQSGKFRPMSDADIVKLLIQFHTFVPEWVRIMRFMRDIPVGEILAGAKFSNLRQILESQPQKLREIVGNEFFQKHALGDGKKLFRDIRSREIGFFDSAHADQTPVLVRRDYEASGGKEVFLSFESKNGEHLFALLRLRCPSSDFKPKFFKSALQSAALVREVHTYGAEISVGQKSEKSAQHFGFGRRLLAAAERIAREEWACKQISVIAGVGTREYYRKFGYELCETFLVKKF